MVIPEHHDHVRAGRAQHRLGGGHGLLIGSMAHTDAPDVNLPGEGIPGARQQGVEGHQRTGRVAQLVLVVVSAALDPGVGLHVEDRAVR